MSAAMRSTLQTVPESLEVTRGADPASSAKTPAKLSTETAKTRTAYSYHTPSATNKVGYVLIVIDLIQLARTSASHFKIMNSEEMPSCC